MRLSDYEINFIKEHVISKGRKWCAKELGRNVATISKKSLELGLINPMYWSDEELHFLKVNYPTETMEFLLAGLPKRNKDTITVKANKLKIYKKETPHQTKEEKLLYQKKYSKNNKEKIQRRKKIYREKNKEKIVKYRNSPEQKEKMRIWRKDYNIKNKERNKLYKQNKLKNNPIYCLSVKIRNVIRRSLVKNGFIKNNNTIEIIGCTFEEFKIHLESKFEPWMTWENRGLYNGELGYGWDIDHIIPLATASSEEDIIRLNHYTNLQPLCSYTNRHIKKDNY